MKDQLNAIRELLDRADSSTTITPEQMIGAILIAINNLIDIAFP